MPDNNPFIEWDAEADNRLLGSLFPRGFSGQQYNGLQKNNSFTGSPFGQYWDEPLILDTGDETPQEENLPRDNYWLYEVIADTNGAKLIDQYNDSALRNVMGTSTDKEVDLIIYYERNDFFNFWQVCLVRMNKALRNYISRGSSRANPQWLAKGVVEHSKTNNSSTIYNLDEELLTEAIWYELNGEGSNIDFIGKVLTYGFHKAAALIRELKYTEQNWNNAAKEYDPIIQQSEDIQNFVSKWNGLKKEIKGYINTAKGASRFLRRNNYVLSADVVDKVAAIYDVYIEAIDWVVKQIEKINGGIAILNAFYCGMVNESMEIAAGLFDLIGAAFTLTDKVQRAKALESIENSLQQLFEHPEHIWELVKQKWGEFAEKYKQATTTCEVAYLAGEDAVDVVTLVQLVQDLINVIRALPKLFEDLGKWAEKVVGKGIKWKDTLLKVFASDTKTDELFRQLKVKLSEFTGEEVLSVKAIKALRRELLEKFNVKLEVIDKNPAYKERLRDWNSRRRKPAASFSPKERTIFIRSEVSVYTIEHEMYHMKLWYKMTQEFPEMINSYKAINELQHEEYVLAQFMKAPEKWSNIDLENDLKVIKIIRDDMDLPSVNFEYFKNWQLPQSK